MRNKGFTLIELLAVIILIALLITLMFPSIINFIKSESDKQDKLVLDLIYNAADIYIKENSDNYSKTNGNSYCIPITDLISDGKLTNPVNLSDEDITNTKSVQITYNNKFNYKVVDKDSCVVKDMSKKIYKNGEVVYFDVVKGERCTEDEYKKSYSEIDTYRDEDGELVDATVEDYQNSMLGYNGINPEEKQNSCLKFYAFNDNGGKKVNLLLDHNTTSVIAWNLSNDNASGPKELLEQLKVDTNDWNGTETPTNYSLDQSISSSKAKYMIDYSDYKARLITAEEIAQITGNKNWSITNEAIENYYFDTNTDTASSTCQEENTSGCKYGWLYDRSSVACTKYGCLNGTITADWDEAIATSGYWTASARSLSEFLDQRFCDYAWFIYSDGEIGGFSVEISDFYGVRPVIEVLRSNLE